MPWQTASMRHFDFLTADDRARLFLHEPEPFGAGDRTLVGVGMGAALYCPATRPALSADILRRRADGAQCVVVCLEDAVADADLDSAERNAIRHLRLLADADTDTDAELPAVFVRVRSAGQIPMIVAGLDDRASALAGFVLPKFDDECGARYLAEVAAASDRLGRPILAMPVLETPAVVHVEDRDATLIATRELVDKYRDLVPVVRVGATDLSAAYGLRRGREFTVWDVRVVGDAIAAIVNVFGRAGDGYPISGPVWEYFPSAERMFKPQLRETPFVAQEERALRAELLAADLDGLIREIALDRANGLTGKTVIHPTHVAAVNALSVVSAEEYADACDILATNAGGGTAASAYGNKMNESKPHTAWAHRVRVAAQVFGVARPGITFVDLLGASLHR